jgi:2-methylisocitrate lyase-like PEP mutase family enzyme
MQEVINQHQQAVAFGQLHRKGDPVILFNIWDAGSAKAIAAMGAKAVATGSASVAMALGYKDGEEVPFSLVVENAQRIARSVNVPVSIDLESGYAEDPTQVAENVRQVMAVGVVGINFEDQIINGEGLYTIEAQCARIAAIRKMANDEGVPLFINARTDIFLKIPPEKHTAQHLEEALQRAAAYGLAGASGFFAPGLLNAQFIGQLCAACQLPVNIMVYPEVPSPKVLGALGVARISYGPRPYRQMITWLKSAGQEALDSLGAR